MDDFGPALSNESMGRNQLLITQAIQEHPRATVDPVPHSFQSNIWIFGHGLGCQIAWTEPTY